MPRPLRSDVFRPEEIAILHCTQRCVRRAYLSGIDSVSGKDYSYRKEWIRQRIEKLASVFGIDVLTYAILSNHLHVVLRNRPDVVAAWSDHLFLTVPPMPLAGWIGFGRIGEKEI